MDVAAYLGTDGTVAKVLPGYEARPQQLAMAQAIAHAIADKKHLMAEAGTGVGKSFAYLVPALLAAQGDPQCRVVVSTHTIHLQEQLLKKDLPLLAKVMPPFRAVLLKGRGNYLSLRRLRVAQQKRLAQLFYQGQQQLISIGQWSRSTVDGSRASLPFIPDRDVWDLVESDSGNCLRRKCASYEGCFYFKARREAEQAQVLIVNHALFFADLALRRQKKSLLPDYRVAIFDEAHTLEDVAAEHLGIDVAQASIGYFLNKLCDAQHKKGLLVLWGDESSLHQWEATRQAADDFFHRIGEWLTPQSSSAVRVREPNVFPNPLSPELVKMADAVTLIAAEIKSDEEKIEYTVVANRLRGLADAIDQWLRQNEQGQVYWAEMRGERFRRPALCSAPIDVGQVLKAELFDGPATCILTSATLSGGGRLGFSHMQHRLGLDGCATMQAGSPFDFRRQVELHLFTDLPDPSADSKLHEEAVIERLPQYIEKTAGRAFVLFTSYQFLRRAADALRGRLTADGYSLITQADGIQRGEMLEQFRTKSKAVLFGVDSFWQGVDVVGDALSNVIITKLPFAPPTQPLTEARIDAIKLTGGNAFFEYQVPQAAIKLKQGFGRLIRSKDDRGLVVIFDPRMLTKRYGQQFLAALPEAKVFVDGVAKESADANDAQWA